MFKSGFIDDENANKLNIHQSVKSDDKNEQEAMDFIRKKDKEWVYIFDKSGKQTARYEGEEGYVNPPEAQLLSKLNNATVVHNHPLDESFSLQDIKAITRYNAKKLIVVSPKYTYIVERNGNYWGFDLDSQTDIAFFEEITTMSEQYLHEKMQEREISYTDKINSLNHDVWKWFFKEKGVFYERKEN